MVYSITVEFLSEVSPTTLIIVAVCFVLIVIYFVRRGKAGAALKKAEQLAAQGDHAGALKAASSAVHTWSFNTAHDTLSTRVAALDRLTTIVDLIARESQAMSRPIDVASAKKTLAELRALLGNQDNYRWGSNVNLKEEFTVDSQMLINDLDAERAALRISANELAGP